MAKWLSMRGQEENDMHPSLTMKSQYREHCVTLLEKSGPKFGLHAALGVHWRDKHKFSGSTACKLRSHSCWQIYVTALCAGLRKPTLFQFTWSRGRGCCSQGYLMNLHCYIRPIDFGMNYENEIRRHCLWLSKRYLNLLKLMSH